MYSSETVKQVNDWMINNISDWMVENGTENTTEGNWIIHIDEIVKKFNVTKNWITAFRDEIVDALYEHKAVADILYDFFPDGDVEDFDIDFYLSFCPNLSDED